MAAFKNVDPTAEGRDLGALLTVSLLVGERLFWQYRPLTRVSRKGLSWSAAADGAAQMAWLKSIDASWDLYEPAGAGWAPRFKVLLTI
jgi:hypothetical protein